MADHNTRVFSIIDSRKIWDIPGVEDSNFLAWVTSGRLIAKICKNLLLLSSEYKNVALQRSVILDRLTLKDGTERFSRNVGKYKSTLHNVWEERRSHWHRGGSLKSRVPLIIFYLDLYVRLLDLEFQITLEESCCTGTVCLILHLLSFEDP